MQSIEKGATKLKKTETVDRSGPNVASGEVKIKKLDRKALLTEIEGEYNREAHLCANVHIFTRWWRGRCRQETEEGGYSR